MKSFKNFQQIRTKLKFYLTKKRKPIPKKVREQVLKMFDGRCSYCGIKPDKLTVDHVVPLANEGAKIDHNDVKNLLPSCFSCNNFKSIMSLEEFRKELSAQPERAFKYSLNYRLAKRYGLIVETMDGVEFYFERGKK